MTEKKFSLNPMIIGIICLFIFAFLNDANLSSFIQLVSSSDVLIADYFQIVGIGTTFLNVALMLSCATFLLYFFDVKIDGKIISSLGLYLGYSFFGKNPVNALPIMTGVLFFSGFQKEKVQQNFGLVLTSTGFSPIITEILFFTKLKPLLRLLLALTIGISLGYMITPVNNYLKKSLKNLSLYPAGFTIGFLSIFFVSFLKLFDHDFSSNARPGDIALNFNIVISIFFLLSFYAIYKNKGLGRFKKLCFDSSININDKYYTKYELLLNLSFNAILTLLYLKLINAPLNAPTFGAFITAIAFFANGKNPRTMLSIYLSILIPSYLNLWKANSPTMIFAALFGTSLSPIVSSMSFYHGILAGFINAVISTKLSPLHMGLNLYNTGFSTGLTATLFAILNSQKKIKGD